MIQTGPRVLTRVVLTVVDFLVAQRPLVTERTVTRERIHTVTALSVDARHAHTLVDVAKAVVVIVTSGAVTAVGVDEVDTVAAIVAGVGHTLINVDLTVLPGVPSMTVTGEGIDEVYTVAVQTRVADTLVVIKLALPP